jgi:hypothetical protein
MVWTDKFSPVRNLAVGRQVSNDRSPPFSVIRLSYSERLFPPLRSHSRARRRIRSRGWEAGAPSGFDERTTGCRKDIEIALAPWCTREVAEVQCRDPERGAGSLGVRGGDDRPIDPKTPCSSKKRWTACVSIGRARFGEPRPLVSRRQRQRLRRRECRPQPPPAGQWPAWQRLRRQDDHLLDGQ